MPKFLRRIWDRKLVQWALACLAGAWMLLQSTTLVGQHFGWPGWIHRAMIALAAVGLAAPGGGVPLLRRRGLVRTNPSRPGSLLVSGGSSPTR